MKMNPWNIQSGGRKGLAMAASPMQFNKNCSSGLPDFSWYSIPKRGKNIPNNHKIYQMAPNYIYQIAVK
jgi:hypothetical protein